MPVRYVHVGKCGRSDFVDPGRQSNKVRLWVTTTRDNITRSIFEFAVYDDGKPGP